MVKVAKKGDNVSRGLEKALWQDKKNGHLRGVAST